MWTRFMDMHSGGGTKEGPYEYIYIEAPLPEAKVIFYNRFGHNPERVSCTCCGPDYVIYEHATLEEATAFERGCLYDARLDAYVDEPRSGHHAMSQWTQRPDVLVIRGDEIEPSERVGDVPEQGYVWRD